MMLRRLHTYLSIASAPIILFFCLTGCLQLFGWHESRGAYHPPAFVEKLAMLHKKQRFAVRGGPHGGAPPAAVAGGSGAETGNRASGPRNGSGQAPPSGGLRTSMLRWLFLFATLSLVASTLMGAWIGFSHARRKRLCWLLLGVGTVLPALLTIL